MLLAAAQEGAGRRSDAIETLEKMLERIPDSFRAQLRLAELYEQDGSGTRPPTRSRRAQALNPRAADDRAAPRGRADHGGPAGRGARPAAAALASGRPDARIPSCCTCSPRASARSKTLDARGGHRRRRSSRRIPTTSRGLHVLSLILQEKGDVNGAERALRDLIARDPLDANALNSLGYMLAERGERLDEAVTLVQRALKVEPANPSFLDSLGWAYYQQGKLDLADPPLSEAAEKLQTNSVVQDHLGDLRFKQQRFADAAAAWERALAGDGESIDRAKIEQKMRDARGRM